MTFEVEVNGKTRSVSVEPVAGTAGRYRIAVDGKEHAVDAREVDESTLSIILLDAGAASFDVEIVETGVAGDLLVHTWDGVMRVGVDRRRRRRSADAGAGAEGEQRVVAPMPGKIVRVLVAAGDEVKAKQGLVVVEAMKMESEIVSPKAGTVKEVAVKEGQSVEAGRVLVVVE
ncbi:MAG: biotin/lipoyl-containing protein [Vicinamibacterales bacterium]